MQRHHDMAVPFEYCQCGSALTVVPMENRQDICLAEYSEGSEAVSYHLSALILAALPDSCR